jgi:hypothetical protein
VFKRALIHIIQYPIAIFVMIAGIPHIIMEGVVRTRIILIRYPVAIAVRWRGWRFGWGGSGCLSWIFNNFTSGARQACPGNIGQHNCADDQNHECDGCNYDDLPV